MESSTLATDHAAGKENTSVPPTPSSDHLSEKEHNGLSAPGHDEELEASNSNTLSRVDTSDFPSTAQLYLIALALVLSVLLVALDLTIVATAVPRISSAFHSLDDVGWYASAFFLTLAAFQSTWGKAYKYFPLKPAFLFSIFIFEIGSLICAVSQNSITLIVGRAVAGVGGAGISSGCYTIIGFAAPPAKRPAFTGILGATFGFASVVGPLLGGVFTQKVSWRWCFYINLPVGATAAAIIFFTFTAPKAARPQKATAMEKFLQMDIPGTFTIMAAAICLFLALQWGGITKPWSDSKVIGTLIGFCLLVIVFIAIEWYQGDRAILPYNLLKDRTIAANCAFVFFLAGSFFVLLYILPLYFQSVKGASAGNSGVRNLPLVLGASLFTIACGVLITVTGHFVPFMIAGSAVSTVAAGLLYTLSVGSSRGEWIGYQALAGIGLGFAFQIPVIANQGLVRISDLSSISAITLFYQTIGGAIFVSASQNAFQNKLIKQALKRVPDITPELVVFTGATELRTVFTKEQLPAILESYVDGIKVAFALCIALSGLAFLVSFFPKWVNLKGKLPTPGAA